MDSSAVTGVISGIPTDWIIIGIALILLALIAMYSGVANLVALSIATLLTSAFIPLIPQAKFLSSFAERAQDPSSQPVVFIALFIPLFIMMRWVTRDTFEDTGPVQAIMAAFATVIIVIVTWQQMPALVGIWDFGGLVEALFNEAYRLWWLLGALLLLTFARG